MDLLQLYLAPVFYNGASADPDPDPAAPGLAQAPTRCRDATIVISVSCDIGRCLHFFNAEA